MGMRGIYLGVGLLLATASVGTAGADDRTYSSFQHAWHFPDAQTDPHSLDGFGVGNGAIFGLLGTRFPLNTLHNAVGPNFSQSAFFGDMALTFYKEGTLPFNAETIRRVKRTAVIETQAYAEIRSPFLQSHLRMQVDDFAVPGENFLIRDLTITNTSGDQAVQGFDLQGIHWGGLYRAENGELSQTRGDARMTLFFTGEGAPTIHDFTDTGTGDFESPYTGDSLWQKVLLRKGPAQRVGVWRIAIPELAPGAAWHITLYLVYTKDSDSAPDAAHAVWQRAREGSAAAWRESTFAYWREWFSRGTQLHMPDAHVADLFDEVALAIKLQQETATGGVSPMSRYRKSWLRDTIGPLRYYLAIGRTEEALQMANYLYSASVLEGHISNSYENSLPVSLVPPPDPGLDFWQRQPFMDNRGKAEAPSYLSLELLRYWQWTGDLTPLRDRYDFLKWSILGQLPSRNDMGLYPMSGDETWRTNMVLLSFSSAWDFIFHKDQDRLSVETHFLLTGAARGMAKLAHSLGSPADETNFNAIASESRAVADRYFWNPDENYYTPFFMQKDPDSREPAEHPLAHVNYMALWSGFLDSRIPAEKARAAQNFDSTIQLLHGQGDDIPFSPSFIGPWAAIFTGMEPGLLLWNMLELKPSSPAEIEKAWNNLLHAATDSGNFFEFYRRQFYGSARLVDDPYGSIGNSTSLYRPWEGGMNMEAAFRYLYGIEPHLPENYVSIAPHLPENWDQISAETIRLGTGTLDLALKKTPQGYLLQLETHHLAGLRAEITLPGDADRAEGVRSIELKDVPISVEVSTAHPVTTR